MFLHQVFIQKKKIVLIFAKMNIIKKISEDTWEIQGTAFLEDISEELGIELSNEEYDTLNGLVFHELGSIPEDGSTIEIDIPGLHITSKSIVDHQLESATVTLVPILEDVEV